MLIRSLTLKNFRCHRNARFEFKEGINLILGKNGAGKSSIVEAIGLALIQGNTLRDAIKDACSLGESSFEIKLEFEGADGNEYVVTRRSSGRTHELVLKGETQPLNIEKLPGLIGIESQNAKDLFTDVICSRQNRIISIFNETSAEVKKQFDRVFNTEIYGKLASENLKNCFDKYKGESDKLVGEIVVTRSNLMADRDTSEAELAASQKRLSDKLAALELVKKELESKLLRKAELDSLSKSALKLEGSINAAKGKLTGKTEARAAAATELERAQAAQKIVEERKDAFERSAELISLLEGLEKEIKKLEIEQKRLEKLNETLGKAENEITRAETNKKSYEIQLNEASAKTADEAASLEKSKAELAEIEIMLKETADRLEDFKRKRGACDEIYEKLAGCERESAEKTRNADERQAALPDEAELNKALGAALNEIAEADLAIKELTELESCLDKAKARLDDNAKYREALEEGFCRILAQTCNNVSKGGEIATGRFDSLAAEFRSEINTLTTKIEALGDCRGENLRRSNKKTEIEQRIETARKEQEIISRLRFESMNLESEKARLTAEIRSFALEHYRKLYDSDFSIDKFREDLHDLGDKLAAEAAKLEAAANEKRNGLKVQSARALSAGQKEDGLRASFHSELKKIEELKIEIDSRREECERSLKLLAPLDKLKSSRESFESEKRELAPGAEEYSQNIKLASSRETIEARIIEIDREAKVLREEIADGTARLTELRGQFSEGEIREAEFAIADLSRIKDERSSEAQAERYGCERLSSELRRDSETREKLAELVNREKRLNQKRALLEKLRDNIKSLGPGINRRIVASIEAEANNYLAALSDTGGKISWETEDGSYAVKLTSHTGEKRSFKSLSGGEQVSVALALRAAMANSLTRSDFAIFDEPTNNLDAARREALRESLGNMLSRLKQAVIITHDDTFEGCENNAIRLGEPA
jgi:DNA repair protein SbcC/Rad50